jgi:hypothetical protein
MGVYDTYGDIQIKAGECVLAEYEIGDETELHDGVYVAHDGIVVIVAGKFVAQFSHLIDKWGNHFVPELSQ